MANKIVKDSGIPILVKEVQVAAAGTAVGSLPAINTLVNIGAVAGLVGDTPRKGEDGAFYANVDTMALIRVTATGTWTDKGPVYITPGGSLSGTATSNVLIGYADRPKTASASGDLWVQLVPKAA